MEISASASTVDTPGVESQSKNDPAGVIATLVGDDPAGVIDEFMGRNIYPVADFIGPHESPPIGPKEEWRVNEESTHCDNVGMTFEAKLREGQAMGLIFIGLASYPSGWWWIVPGAISMALMFVFVSIPLMDERNLERREGYAEHMNRTSNLIPLPPK